MHREFEELGVAIGGIPYGHFTGEVQFDETGRPVVIDIEPSGFEGKAMRLDIEELVKERIGLRRKLGVSFLEDGGFEVREHLKRWVLFVSLSESIAYTFREDVSEYLAELRGNQGRHWNAA